MVRCSAGIDLALKLVLSLKFVGQRVILLDLLDPVANRLNDFLLVNFLGVVDCEDVAFHFFLSFLSIEPVFMFFMESLKVV